MNTTPKIVQSDSRCQRLKIENQSCLSDTAVGESWSYGGLCSAQRKGETEKELMGVVGWRERSRCRILTAFSVPQSSFWTLKPLSQESNFCSSKPSVTDSLWVQDTKALATHECQVRVSLSGGAFGLTDGLNLWSFKEISAEWLYNLITLAFLLSLIKLFNS